VGPRGLQREVVQDQQLDSGQPAHLVVQGVVEAGGLEPFEQLGGAGHVHGAAPPDRDVPQRASQVGLAHPDRPENHRPVRAVDEPQAG
jgi:hypothetical protein